MTSYAALAQALRPEASLVGGALIALAVDLTLGRRQSEPARLAVAASIGLFAIAAALFQLAIGGTADAVVGNVLVLDRLTFAARVGVLVLAALTLALLPGVARHGNPAEYVAIILFATSGFTLMGAAQNLLIAFIALELASLSLYVLAAFDRSRPESAEAALKYFLVGGVSAAFLLFGFSLLYGLTGSIELRRIAEQLGTQPATPLLIVTLVFVVVGFAFKAAAAPFHLWAPDVYQGAPATSAALIASASKLAGVVLFVRLFWTGLHPAAGGVSSFTLQTGWQPAVAAVAAASLLVGNLGALAQTNVRRLLAYSAIGHAGALLLGVAAAGGTGPAWLYYYALTYGIAVVGAFGVIAVLDAISGCQRIEDLAGLQRRSPVLAGCLLVFILSLAGIPPLAGFLGKFGIFAAALKVGGVGSFLGVLTLLAIALSAVSLYYYLLVLKQAYVVPATETAARIRVPIAAATALVTAAVLLLVLGLYPAALLGIFE